MCSLYRAGNHCFAPSHLRHFDKIDSTARLFQRLELRGGQCSALSDTNAVLGPWVPSHRLGTRIRNRAAYQKCIGPKSLLSLPGKDNWQPHTMVSGTQARAVSMQVLCFRGTVTVSDWMRLEISNSLALCASSARGPPLWLVRSNASETDSIKRNEIKEKNEWNQWLLLLAEVRKKQ